MMEGLVMKSTGSWYTVRGTDQKDYSCRTRGKLKLKGFKTTNPIAVGDRVAFELEPTNDDHLPSGLIFKILDRENYIIRKSIQKTGHGHIIAANIDQAMLIATIVYPRTSLGFIDRFLVSAEAFRIPQIIVFNKADILDDALLEHQQQVIAIYEQLDIPCLTVSALTEKGLQELQDYLSQKTTLISGHSGVGKSTLVNKIAPQIAQKTGKVSDFAQKGIHTTTFAEMFALNENTMIIDTPGIKELGLIDIGEAELSDYFPEMRERAQFCKFHNCRHTHEPRCAIKEGIEAGEIAPTRYDAYLSMLEDHDNRR